MQNSMLYAQTKTNTNPNPDPNRYRRRCPPDPNARIQKFIHYVNHKKGGRTFVIITQENLDGFL